MIRKLLQCCRVPVGILNKIAPYSYEQAKEALLKNDFELLAKILQSGVEMPVDEDSLLMLALSEGKEEAALFLMRDYQHLFQFNRRNDKGDSLIMVAIYRGLHRMIKMLVDKCDLNGCDFRRNTPFIAAAANGDIETLKLLSDREGCKMLVRNDEGQSALHRACYFGEIEAVQWLLLNTELKVRERDKRGNNALHLACEGVNIHLSRYLMEKVCDSQSLLCPNSEGKTPLQVLMATIESVAPNIRENLHIEHLKPQKE